MILRAPEPTDIDSLFLWENDEDRLRQGCGGVPVSRFHIWDFIKNYNKDFQETGQLRLMFDTDTVKPAGIVDLYDINLPSRRAFAAIYVDKSLRKIGLGSMALNALENFAFEQLALEQLAAFVAANNEPSIKLFKKNGYCELATIDNWLRDSNGSLRPVILFRKFINHLDEPIKTQL